MASNYEIKLNAAISDESIKKAIAKVNNKQTINFRVSGDKEFLSVTNKIRDGMSKITTETERFRKTADGSFTSVSKSIRIVNGDASELSSKLGNVKDSLVSFAASFGAITTATELIKEMVNAVIDMDGALTEYKKVSDLTGQGLESFISKASEVGDTVSRTTTEMIEGSTEFRKSGYTDEDSLQLAKIGALYQNVADVQMTAGQSANFIIAQMKAFNIEAQDAIHIVDAINNVSNNYAVSSADLANNLGNVSSTMAEGKTSYEQTLGLAH